MTDENTPYWIAVDLDGTVANCDHRLKFIMNLDTCEKLPSKQRNYNKFFENCIEDEPIIANIRLVKQYIKTGHSVTFITGRPEKMLEESCLWIEKHITDDFSMFMRRNDDYRPDYETKMDLMVDAVYSWGNTPVAFFEDRPMVFKKWNAYLPATKAYFCGKEMVT